MDRKCTTESRGGHAMAHMVVKYLIVLRNVVPTLSAVYSTLQHFPVQYNIVAERSVAVCRRNDLIHLLHFRRFDFAIADPCR